MKATIETPARPVTSNPQQRLYAIPCAGGGFTCHGFDVVERLIAALIREGLTVAPPLCKPIGTVDPSAAVGTPERYAYYSALCGEGSARNALSGWRSAAELTPALIGMEGRRVEVRHRWKSGEEETVRFNVGKSTGWMPCHLQIHNSRAHGGPAVCLGEILSVRVIR